MTKRTIGERASRSWGKFNEPKPVFDRNKNVKLETRLDPRTHEMIQVPKNTSWAKRTGYAALLFAAVSLITDSEEFSRQIVSAETSGAVTIVTKTIGIISGSVSGGSEGLCETADGFCDEVGERATGVGNAITGTETSLPQITIDDVPVSPEGTATTLPPVTTLAPDTTATTIPEHTATTTTSLPETTTTLDTSANSISIGPLVCSDIFEDVVMGDNTTPGIAVASLSPELEAAGWAKIGPLYEFVVSQSSNDGLPSEGKFTRQTVIHDVPTDCR